MSGKLSVIVFDLGNVLIPFDYSIVIRKFNDVSPGLGDKFMDFYMNNYKIHRQFESGKISEDEFLQAMLGALDHKMNKEQFCRDYSEVFTVDTKMTALLPELKKNYKLVLLSNTNSIHRKYGWDHYEFLKNFDKLILSYEVGAYKPEKEIYLAAQEFTQKPAAEHLFIDDVADYAEGARKVGWDAVQFTGYENLLDTFKERGIVI